MDNSDINVNETGIRMYYVFFFVFFLKGGGVEISSSYNSKQVK